MRVIILARVDFQCLNCASIIIDNNLYQMDTTDVYAHRRLLYKCDASISKIYSNVFKMLLEPDAVI